MSKRSTSSSKPPVDSYNSWNTQDKQEAEDLKAVMGPFGNRCSSRIFTHEIKKELGICQCPKEETKTNDKK